MRYFVVIQDVFMQVHEVYGPFDTEAIAEAWIEQNIVVEFCVPSILELKPVGA